MQISELVSRFRNNLFVRYRFESYDGCLFTPAYLMHTITIDMGTTNTRTSLWRDGKLLAEGSAAVGVRDAAITGNKDTLKDALRVTIASALRDGGVKPGNIDLALASGMIGAKTGLLDAPHWPASATWRKAWCASPCQTCSSSRCGASPACATMPAGSA
jgi:hypothetical protein